ncbi:hypothetical protein, partial [Corynebacterium belfantii]|uniref:hypothetical protein n=1 Tax=Corynebacterium belfantii TaxID=2014537 RepID=UPI001F29A4B4
GKDGNEHWVNWHQSNTKQSWNQPHPLRPKNQKENCQPNPQQTRQARGGGTARGSWMSVHLYTAVAICNEHWRDVVDGSDRGVLG